MSYSLSQSTSGLICRANIFNGCTISKNQRVKWQDGCKLSRSLILRLCIAMADYIIMHMPFPVFLVNNVGKIQQVIKSLLLHWYHCINCQTRSSTYTASIMLGLIIDSKKIAHLPNHPASRIGKLPFVTNVGSVTAKGRCPVLQTAFPYCPGSPKVTMYQST